MMELALDPLVLNIEATAEALSLSRTSVYTLIGSNRLKAIRIGRRRLVTVESIRELIANELSAL